MRASPVPDYRAVGRAGLCEIRMELYALIVTSNGQRILDRESLRETPEEVDEYACEWHGGPWDRFEIVPVALEIGEPIAMEIHRPDDASEPEV